MSLEITPDWCFMKISSVPLFYNYKEDLVSLTLPCPIKNIKQFIKVYNLDITCEELANSIKKINKKADFDGKKILQNGENLLDPITDEEKLQEFLNLSKTQSISNVFEQISKYKYGILLNGSYYRDPENNLYKYTYFYRKIKLYEGPFEMFKKVARKNCLKEIIKIICPTIFEEIYHNYEIRHNIKYNIFNLENEGENNNNIETNNNLNEEKNSEEIISDEKENYVNYNEIYLNENNNNGEINSTENYHNEEFELNENKSKDAEINSNEHNNNNINEFDLKENHNDCEILFYNNSDEDNPKENTNQVPLNENDNETNSKEKNDENCLNENKDKIDSNENKNEINSIGVDKNDIINSEKRVDIIIKKENNIDNPTNNNNIDINDNNNKIENSQFLGLKRYNNSQFKIPKAKIQIITADDSSSSDTDSISDSVCISGSTKSNNTPKKEIQKKNNL